MYKQTSCVLLQTQPCQEGLGCHCQQVAVIHTPLSLNQGILLALWFC